ncbi:MAG: YbhB/YbcL family Raf kinase inhibitor-like protein [Candidatus Peregrinibacteria bacterium]
MNKPILISLAIGSIMLAGCVANPPVPPVPPVNLPPGPVQAPVEDDVTTIETIAPVSDLNFQITGYANGATIPAPFATRGGGGNNVSIGAQWSPISQAKSYALLFDDIHPMADHWVHWLVVDIPAEVTTLAEGASRSTMPTGSRELITSWGKTGYDGPQPPPGSGPHEYVARLYALDIEKLDVPNNVSRNAFLKAVESHTLISATYSGFFGR